MAAAAAAAEEEEEGEEEGQGEAEGGEEEAALLAAQHGPSYPPMPSCVGERTTRSGWVQMARVVLARLVLAQGGARSSSTRDGATAIRTEPVFVRLHTPPPPPSRFWHAPSQLSCSAFSLDAVGKIPPFLSNWMPYKSLAKDPCVAQPRPRPSVLNARVWRRSSGVCQREVDKLG